MITRVWHTAEMLNALGVRKGDHVALYLENRPEWPEIYFGISALGAVAVPLDAKLREQEVAHILHDSGAKALFAGARNYPVIRDIEGKLPVLKAVVLIDGHTVLPVRDGKLRYEAYVDFYRSMADRAMSAARAYDQSAPEEEDVASLIYTSGTTGRPKGAMLSHRNFTANVASCLEAIGVNEQDNFMLVLPLHHAFAFTTNLLVPVGAGAEISFVESLKTIRENMEEARPTVLIGVPLLLEKMYSRIQEGLRKKPVARLMLAVGLSRLVGKKLVQRLGGKLRIVVSGAAPIDPRVLEGWGRLGVMIREGYGLTETAPVDTLNPPDRNKPGTIGVAVPGVDIRILEPNEEGVGEIVVQGPNVMQGYYKNEAATREIFREGWLLTGDLGRMDEEGFVTICGRKKSLIVNREGKNIYPEEVEYQVGMSPYILEVLVLGYRAAGEKAGERVGLIAVPDQEALDQYATQHKKELSDRAVEHLIQSEVKKRCRHLADYKRPRCIQVQFEEFEKTSTQKIKRYLYAIDTTRFNGD
jgi:long-chain acyl-CoA synthetase